MGIPEEPSNQDFLEPQYGYKDIDVKTQKYSDDPTPLSAEQGAASAFVSKHTDKEHQKKYAKKAGKKVFNILIRQLCH